MLNERQDAWGDSPSLYFFILTHLESGRAQLRLVNRLPLPSSLSGPPARTDSELQVLLVDGPHVVLFSRAAQQVTIVRLFQDGDMAEFHVWRDAIRLCCGTDQDVLGVTSCEFVPSTAATHAHLLIHADYSLPTDSGNERYSHCDYCASAFLDLTSTGWYDAVIHASGGSSTRPTPNCRSLCYKKPPNACICQSYRLQL